MGGEPAAGLGQPARAAVHPALRGADLVVHLTEWPQFRELAPEWARTLVSRPRIVDGRGTLDMATWAAAGWEFRAPGRPAPGGEG
ncbi:UDP binding domain-containing protein [Streptomyces sp. NPDC059517]|uniref:UDP binding domain-containing protein n=1 Tax=Streptomyces sp. NPDC059517 TaxID=3346855 RepID=UPI003697CD6C